VTDWNAVLSALSHGDPAGADPLRHLLAQLIRGITSGAVK
jgi:hypothetical protein